MAEPVKKSFGNLPGPGPGRPKGVQNKNTTLLKDAILQAAENAGGKDGLVGYLGKQADEEPVAFMALLGKVLPMQITGENGGAIEVADVSDRERARAMLLLATKVKDTP